MSVLEDLPGSSSDQVESQSRRGNLCVGTDQIRVKEFQCATFEHDSASPPQAYEADAHPRDVTAVLFTTQLCFFPPWKDLIPFLSVQLRYSDAPNGVKVGNPAMSSGKTTPDQMQSKV